MRPVLEALLAAAKEKRVHWRESRETFSVVFPRSTIELWEYNEESGDTGVGVKLLNAQGLTAALESVPDSADKDSVLLRALVQCATRACRGIDEALRDAMKELQKQGPVGEQEIPF